MIGGGKSVISLWSFLFSSLCHMLLACLLPWHVLVFHAKGEGETPSRGRHFLYLHVLALVQEKVFPGILQHLRGARYACRPLHVWVLVTPGEATCATEKCFRLVAFRRHTAWTPSQRDHPLGRLRKTIPARGSFVTFLDDVLGCFLF